MFSSVWAKGELKMYLTTYKEKKKVIIVALFNRINQDHVDM